LNACYRDALTRGGQRIEGAVTFTLSIDSSGVIASPVVSGTPIDRNPTLVRCFQQALANRQLPANALEAPAATAEVWVSLKPE
jgi:hypothetical protein